MCAVRLPDDMLTLIPDECVITGLLKGSLAKVVSRKFLLPDRQLRKGSSKNLFNCRIGSKPAPSALLSGFPFLVLSPPALAGASRFSMRLCLLLAAGQKKTRCF